MSCRRLVLETQSMRLYRFPYSCYARYVQASIELAKVPCEIVDVPFGDRNELAILTGGSILVPVVVLDDGTVLKDSHHIMTVLTRDDPRFGSLVPEADAGPIWAYADWACSLLEDAAFRVATPGLAARFLQPFERALFVFVKERKFGPGCVETWAHEADAWFEKVDSLLAPTRATLRARDFLFGRRPTLADTALYGQLIMLDFGAPERSAALGPVIRAWRERLEPHLGPPPYGRVAAAHRTFAELDERFGATLALERSSKLAKIIRRPMEHGREAPRDALLDPTVGLIGDRWKRGPRGNGDQVSLMDVRVARAIADEADWELFGDNLFVDFDLGATTLAPGDRLRIGDVQLEVTAEPHLGCRKFSARFGSDALRWVNQRELRDQRRRGIFARVLEGGTIRVGDPVVRHG